MLLGNLQTSRWSQDGCSWGNTACSGPFCPAGKQIHKSGLRHGQQIMAKYSDHHTSLAISDSPDSWLSFSCSAWIIWIIECGRQYMCGGFEIDFVIKFVV